MGVSLGLLTKGQVAALDRYYGVGQPAIQQYWSWLHALFSGNLGISLVSREPVSTLIGTASARDPGAGASSPCCSASSSASDSACGVRCTRGAGRTISARESRSSDWRYPTFILGTVLVVFMSSKFHYFPSSLPFAGLFTNPWLNFQQIIIPAFVLSLGIARRDSAHDPRGGARSGEPQLRAHRPRQGGVATGLHLAPPLSQRSDGRDDDEWHPTRLPARGHRHHRADLHPARDGSSA